MKWDIDVAWVLIQKKKKKKNKHEVANARRQSQFDREKIITPSLKHRQQFVVQIIARNTFT
jgi:hypothetical protein